MTREPGLPSYDDAASYPPRVWRAVENTRRDGFDQACLPEVGRLLQLLASLSGVQRACELGTAYGVGAAWIESGLGPSAQLVTVEADPRRAAAGRLLFGDHERVTVIHGDWSAAKDRRLFDLVFSDGGPKRNRGDPAKLLPMLKRGGLVVLDDFTPNFGLDPARDMWLGDPGYRAMELTLSPRASVILATKR